MKRFLYALVVLLWTLPAWAQVPMTGAGLATPAPPPTFVGSGDALAGAAHFHSVRAYTSAKAAVAQKLIGFIRISDSHTCDILAATAGGFGVTGNCSTGGDNGATISSWCAATTCNSTVIYDQIGTDDVTASGTAGALTISCLNSKPCLAVPGSGWATGTITALSQPASYSVVMERTAANVGCWVCDSNSAGTGINFQGTSTANQLQLYAGGGFNITATPTDNAFNAIQVVINGASSVANVNGVEAGNTGNAGAQNGSTVGRGIGAANGNSAPFMTGFMAEVRIDAVAYSAGNRTTLCNNQRLYFGTPGSC